MCAIHGGVCSTYFLIQNLTDDVPEMRWEESLICGSCQDHDMKKVLHFHLSRGWAKSCMTGSGHVSG